MDRTHRPGRPSLDEDGAPSTQVGVRLPPHEFDQVYQRATRDRITVAERIRRDITIATRHDRDA